MDDHIGCLQYIQYIRYAAYILVYTVHNYILCGWRDPPPRAESDGESNTNIKKIFHYEKFSQRPKTWYLYILTGIVVVPDRPRRALPNNL